MTQHDLVPLSPSDFARLVAGCPDIAAHQISEDLPRWLGSGRGHSVAVVGWCEPAPLPWSGRLIRCCLEAERAASGSLVHLTAAFGRPVMHPVGQHVAAVFLQKWAAHRLAGLRARAGESIAVRRVA